MAGINPDLGKNFKLQQLELNSTVNVDTQKTEGKDVGDVKPAAVWLVGHIGNISSVEMGDVIIRRNGRELEYFRVGIDINGKVTLLPMNPLQHLRSDDFESDRGTFREPFNWVYQ